MRQENSSRQQRPKHFGFLLLPEYTMIAVVSAIDTLRLANRQTKHILYTWRTLTEDGEPVEASNGFQVKPDGAMADATDCDVIFVCGGINVERHAGSQEIARFLRGCVRRRQNVGGICTGSYVLANAGLLDDVRCTIHWELIDTLRSSFPHLDVTSQLFEIEAGKYTCSGGQAPMHMMLSIIRQQHGSEVAAQVADVIECERIRQNNETHRIPMHHPRGPSHPKLQAIISLMNAHIDDPVSLDVLAKHSNMSNRQVQRLFQDVLSVSPTRYYLQLRLERARQLLHFTNSSMLDIALSCGFSSAPHFSKAYRNCYGISPSEERSNLSAR